MSTPKINSVFRTNFSINFDILPDAVADEAAAADLEAAGYQTGVFRAPFPRLTSDTNLGNTEKTARRKVALYGLYQSAADLVAIDLMNLFGLFAYGEIFDSNLRTSIPIYYGVDGSEKYEQIISFSTPSKEEVYNKIIKPKLVTWVNNNVTNSDLKLVYQTWLRTDSNIPNIIEAIDYAADGPVVGSSISDFLFRALPPFTVFNYQDYNIWFQVPLAVFFLDLERGTNVLGNESADKVEGQDTLGGTSEVINAFLDVPAILGFDEALDEVLGEGSALDQNPRTAVELEAALLADPSLFSKIAAGAQGVDYSSPTAEELISLRQCGLITRLLHNTPKKISFSHYFNNGSFNSPLTVTGSTGESRIMLLDPDFDPNLFYNKCHISNAAKNTLVVKSTADVTSGTIMRKSLFWVFEAGGKLKEIELSLTTNRKEQKETENYYQLTRALEIFRNSNPNITLEQRKLRAKSLTKQDFNNAGEVEQALNTRAAEKKKAKPNSPGQSYYYLNDVEIKYEGTNPSTARNDVQVQMSFTLSSMEALQCTMATIKSAVTGTTDDVDIKLYELVTLPINNSVTKGPGSYLENQFNPEYSRVRLKVYTGDGNGCDLIIDLSTIDHSISRESETGTTTLTINYRGFFEAMMNMPFNDALADEATLQRRESLHKKAMGVITGANCKPELINKALRIEQEIFRRESKELSAMSILQRLSAKKLIHGYGLAQDKIQARAINGTLDAFQDYVTAVHPGLVTYSAAQIKKMEEVVKKVRDGGKAEVEGFSWSKFVTGGDPGHDLDFLQNTFFFLGDLMHVISGCLYVGDSTKMRPVVKNMNMRFLIGTINVPDPTAKDGSMMSINPACIPVDVAYFTEWFNSTIINKGITTQPVGIFTKELLERLVNSIIFEACFSSMLPSENPPMIRMSFLSDYSNDGWFKKGPSGWFNPNQPRLNGLSGGDNLFKKDAQFNLTTLENAVYDTDPQNYCVIYQQFPTFSQYTTKEAKQKMRNTSFVPTILYGAKNTNFNYASNVSFSKTDSPFLREARYFNSSYGNLSLLSNVYDLSFSFVRRMGNTFLYPGIIINFALLDWTSKGSESPYVKIASNSSKQNNKPSADDYTVLGQSNPHSPKTLAHILGFGGYYIIKSVTYKLGQTEDNFEIAVTTKFMGTDAIKSGTRGGEEETPRLEDKKECVDAFNKFVTRVNSLDGGSSSETFEVANVSKKTTSNNDKSNDNEEKVNEIPEEEVFDTSSPDEEFEFILSDVGLVPAQELATEGTSALGGTLITAQELGQATINHIIDQIEVFEIKNTHGDNYQLADGRKIRLSVQQGSLYNGTTRLQKR